MLYITKPAIMLRASIKKVKNNTGAKILLSDERLERKIRQPISVPAIILEAITIKFGIKHFPQKTLKIMTKNIAPSSGPAGILSFKKIKPPTVATRSVIRTHVI